MSMRAISQSAAGGVDTLCMASLPIPQPGPGQLLIKVAASGVNRADLVQRAGRYPPPKGASPLLGLEISGVIAGIGDEVEGFSLGQSVFGLVEGGGYAQYALLDADCAIAKPDWLSHVEAASLPEAWMTAIFNLLVLGKLEAGETALIHAGASGVGAAAIQLCKLLGAPVLCTVGSAAKAAFCVALGATAAINYREQPFANCVKSYGGVDVILDCVGGGYLEDNLSSLKPDGRLLLIGLLGGSKAQLDLGRLLIKRLSLRGSTLRPQSLACKQDLSARLREMILPALGDGRVRCSVDKVFDWQAVAAAHQYLEANANFGKVVLEIQP